MSQVELNSTDCVHVNGDIIASLEKICSPNEKNPINVFDLIRKISLPHNSIPLQGLRVSKKVLNKLVELNYIKRYKTKIMVNPALAFKECLLTPYVLKVFKLK